MNFFTNLYEVFAGVHNERELLSQEVFPVVGLLMLGITFLTVIIYYYVLNSVGNQVRFNRTSYWVVFMLLNALIHFFIALNRIGRILEVASDDYEGYFYVFAVTNAFYSVLVYIIFSLVFKNWSKHAPYTPVKFPLR
jgi:hypothetical protein